MLEFIWKIKSTFICFEIGNESQVFIEPSHLATGQTVGRVRSASDHLATALLDANLSISRLLHPHLPRAHTHSLSSTHGLRPNVI